MSQTNKKKRRRKVQPRFYVIITMFIVLILLLAFLIGFLIRWACVNMSREEGADPVAFSDFVKGATPAPTPTPSPSPTPEPTPTPKPTPYMVAASNPEQYGFVPHLMVDGSEVMANSYRRSEEIEFPDADAYNAENIKGILTFRGNNWRNASSCGTVEMTEYKMTKVWEVGIGSLQKGSGKNSWSGCGWTGQPLMVQWPAETRRIMNLYDWAKEKDNLVEVIYPTEDGNIYFIDLETGKQTRDTIVMRVPFKGTGSIDPRGLPLLYCGSGDQYQNDDQKSRAFIISLINGRVLYEFGKQDTDAFARRKWYAYDSAPLIDAETDTLIYPGENGIVYTMKLNTVYDPVLGSISVNPSNEVKYRYDCNNIYDNTDLADSTHKWQGFEGSAAAWNGYLYLSSNDGMFQCVDLNTMQCVWIANTEDDTNGSPVLDVISETEAYLYVGTSLHFTKDKNNKGIAPFFKIDAMTGEIKGRYGLTVETVKDVSRGIQSTAAVGKAGSNISNLVYIMIAGTDGNNSNKYAGVLVALDKNDFNHVVWDYKIEDTYSWSSPTVVYNAAGKGYVIQADSNGRIYLFDGATGALLDINSKLTDTNFEASPAVFGNMLVVGCRGDMRIFGVRLS